MTRGLKCGCKARAPLVFEAEFQFWSIDTCLTTNESSARLLPFLQHHGESANLPFPSSPIDNIESPRRGRSRGFLYSWGWLWRTVRCGLKNCIQWFGVRSMLLHFRLPSSPRFFVFPPRARPKQTLLSAEACHRFREHLCSLLLLLALKRGARDDERVEQHFQGTYRFLIPSNSLSRRDEKWLFVMSSSGSALIYEL